MNRTTGGKRAELARRLEGLRLTGVPARGRVGCGIGPIDRLLGGGVRTGSLVEWTGWGRAHGATTLALLVARGVCGRQKRLVVVDQRGDFYPPAAVAWGIRPAEMILVRCTAVGEEYWAVEQALRCRAVGAVLTWPDRLSGRQLRRWQLAAERGGGVGLVVSGSPAREVAGWAETRLRVRPRPGDKGRRLRLELLRHRGGPSGSCLHLEIDEATGTIRETLPVPVAAELADSTAAG